MEQRRHGAPADEVRKPRVVGMRGDADARGQQLRPRGGDDERFIAAGDAEADLVERAFHRPVLDLRLRHRGAEVHVPHGRRLERVDLALLQQVEEALLRDAAAMVGDRRVFEAPVDRQAEPLEQRLERLLVLAGQFEAQLDEVRARDLARRLLALRVVRLLELQAGLVRHARLGAHVVIVLHAAFGGQAVVVPAHRVEHVAAAHPPEARQRVRLRVAEDVADVQRTGDGRRRRVYRKARRGRVRIEAVGAVLFPQPAPPLFGFTRIEMRGEL